MHTPPTEAAISLTESIWGLELQATLKKVALTFGDNVEIAENSEPYTDQPTSINLIFLPKTHSIKVAVCAFEEKGWSNPNLVYRGRHYAEFVFRPGPTHSKKTDSAYSKLFDKFIHELRQELHIVSLAQA